MAKSSVDDRWSSTRLALKKIGPLDPGHGLADSRVNRREATVAATWPRTFSRESKPSPRRDRFACFMAKKAETRGPFVLVRCSVDRQVGSDSMVI